MSTPRTLQIPDAVLVERIDCDRGSFATHRIDVADPRGHLLLLPGWTGSKEDFTQFLPYVAAAGFSATAYDQRGQFETPGGPDDDYSLSALAMDAAAVARAVSDAPVHLLGHSFGGLVAQTAAIEQPDRWRSLSLLCTGPGKLDTPDAHPLATLVEALETVSLADIHEQRQAALEVHPPADIADFVRHRFTSNAPRSLQAFTMHLATAEDRIDELAATRLPVWVGRGAEDDAWPHAVQHDMAHRLGTEVVVLAGAAHSPAVENPRALADALTPFLRQAG